MKIFITALALTSILIIPDDSVSETSKRISRQTYQDRNVQRSPSTNNRNFPTAHQGCSVGINNVLPEPQPLLLKPNGNRDGNGFFPPEDAAGTIRFGPGQEVRFACPGSGNGFRNPRFPSNTAKAFCNSGTKFYVNSSSYDFSAFACKYHPNDTARELCSKCHDCTKLHIEVGFEVGRDFYKLLDICFDDSLHTTLYVNATVVPRIAGFQQVSARPRFTQDDFYPGLSVDDLYNGYTKFRNFAAILCPSECGVIHCYQTSGFYLSRGHLAAKADFMYGAQQNATFHFVNAAPQWQTFNGGNWQALEESVRRYADKNKVNLDVYTGTYGILTHPDDFGIERELYLYVDSNKRKAIPVPKFFWKAVYDRKNKAGIVYVGINLPYIPCPLEDYKICDDNYLYNTRVDPVQYDITGGYIYCCSVTDFRRNVGTLPNFPVGDLLLLSFNKTATACKFVATFP